MNRATAAADKTVGLTGLHGPPQTWKENLLRGVLMLIGAVPVAALLAAAMQLPAGAAELSYLGDWKLVSAVPAPWAPSPDKVDAAEVKELVGKTVTFAPKAITGPKVFVCKGPHYKLSDFSADMLFEGQFGDMHDADHSKDPLQLAHALGFTGTSFKTLETGCEIDWHFVDPRTVEIGLNNFVYTLKKQ